MHPSRPLLLSLLFGLLPSLAPAQDWAQLAKYAEANSRLPAPSKSRPRVVLMGNSITEAWVNADSAFFRNPKYELIGRGISGQTTSQMVVRLRQDVVNLKPAVVAILAGTNDIAGNTGPYDEAATLNNLESMVDLARANGIRVVLCAILPVYDYPWKPGLNPAQTVVALNARLRAYAARNHIPFVDYHTPMADERLGLKAELAPDGVHPNRAGYAIMGPLLLGGIAAAMKEKL